MTVRNDLLYSKDHEWVKVDGDKVYVGITEYAQSELGDIVFVELPEVDDELEQDGQLGVVESVKAVADIISPVSGRVLEVNTELEDSPELINEDAYEAWIAVVQLDDTEQLKSLLTAEQYQELIQN